MTPSDILKAMVTAIEGRDAEAFAALFAEDAVGYHPMFPGGVRGRAAIKEAEQSLFAAFDDVQVRGRRASPATRRSTSAASRSCSPPPWPCSDRASMDRTIMLSTRPAGTDPPTRRRHQRSALLNFRGIRDPCIPWLGKSGRVG